MKHTDKRYLLAAAAIAAAFVPSAASAATWTGASSGDWSTTGNWSDAALPSGAIDYGTGTVANATQSLNGSYNLTSIVNGATSAVILNNGTGTNTLTFDTNATTVLHASTANLTLGAGSSIAFGPNVTAATFTSAAGRTLSLASAINLTNTNGTPAAVALTVSGAGATVISGDITGSGTIASSGPLTISGANSANITSTGSFVLAATGSSSGVLNVTGGAITGNTTGTINMSGGGTLTINGTNQTINNFNIGGNGAVVNITSGANVTSNGNIIMANSSTFHTLNSFGTVNNSGAFDVRAQSRVNIQGGNWTQTGSMTIQSQNTNNYNAIMAVNGGTFTYNGSSAITLAGSTAGATAIASLTVNSGGTFVTSRNFYSDQTVAAGTFSLNGGTLRISANIASIYTGVTNAKINFSLGGTAAAIDTNGFSTAVDLAITGGGKLNKSGAGTLTLSKANAYTGGTAVGAGTLSVTGSILVSGASGVTVASGATLAVAGALQLTSATSTIDNLGTVSLTGGTAVLDLNNQLTGLTDGQTYSLFSTPGSITGNFASITGYDNANFTAAFNNTTGALTFTAVPVPEPSTYGLLGAGTLALVSFVRRRRRA